jgi:hypothetical protein
MGRAMGRAHDGISRPSDEAVPDAARALITRDSLSFQLAPRPFPAFVGVCPNLGPVILVAAALAGCRAEDERRTLADEGGRGVQPDTTAGALGAYLDAAGYRNWPGSGTRGRLYRGQEPHGALISTYSNEIAAGVLQEGGQELPPGSIVVLESYTPDSVLAAVSVMYKAEGYDGANGDWYWLQKSPQGTVEAYGRWPTCSGCHAIRRRSDFVFGVASPPAGESR